MGPEGDNINVEWSDTRQLGVVKTMVIRKGCAQPKDLNSKLLKTTHWPNIGLWVGLNFRTPYFLPLVRTRNAMDLMSP